MSDLPPVTQKFGADTTDFKAGIAQINRELRVVESAFRANAAALGDWGKDAQGLEMRIQALNKEIDLQKTKVSALQAEYKRVADEKGATSKAAQELEIKLNRETETLGKMQSELSETETSLQGMGENSEEAGGKVQDLGNKEDEAAGKTNKFKGAMEALKAGLKAGVLAIAGLATAVAGVGVALGKLVLDAAGAAAELVDLSAKTGISTTRLQELAYVGDQVGTSQETMVSSLARLTRSMAEAQQQQADYNADLANAKTEEDKQALALGELAAAFDTLGVSVTDSNGNLKDSETVFAEALTALGGIQNEAERDALAMQIFGRSAMELNPLIKAGSDEIARLSQEAHNVGAVMSEDTVAGLEAFDDQLASLKAGLKGTLGELAGAFVPAFSGLATQAQTYLGKFGDIVRGADGDLGKMADGIGKLLGEIITDLAKQGPEMLKAGLQIVQGILNAIIQNAPQLIQGAVAMIKTLVDFLVSNAPMLMQAGVDLLLALVNGIVPQLPTLIEAGIQMILSLINGLAEALPQIIPVIVEVIPTIVTTLLENLPLLVEAALNLIIALAEGLIAALPTLIAAIPEIIAAVYDAIIVALPKIGEAALELIKTLAKGIVENLPRIGEAVVEIVHTITTKVTELGQTILQVGADIVKGVWQGIKDNAGWFGDQIAGFFKGMVDAAKKALGIQSPSTVFAGIGENMALGLGKGFAASMTGVQNQVDQALSSLTAGMSGGINLNLAGAAAGGGGATYNLGGVTVNIQGDASPQKTAQAVELGVTRALRRRGAA